MRPQSIRLWVLAIGLPAMALAASEQELALEKIRKHLKPLTYPLGDRMPILTWQNRMLPMGLSDGRVAEVQGVYLDRGFLPTCNGCANVKRAKTFVPVFKYWQSRGFPVCFLPQGWVQREFMVARNGKFKCAHRPPASTDHTYPCPAAMMDARRAARIAKSYKQTLQALRDSGVDVKLLMIDFESAAYLRNAADREASVLKQLDMARQCPACLKTFGEERLAGPAEYAKIVNEARAFATLKMLGNPLREIYPKAYFGNYYAWPVSRVPRPEGRWPAYGFEGSGLNVAMPRVYMNAGWGGAGRDQEKMNWNALYCCLEGFSPAASMLREGEWLIPWTHVWLGGRYLDFVMTRKKRVPEIWAMSEVARHMMLRGAETFAIWVDAQIGKFPDDYPYPEYAEMGQFVYDVKGIQEGFNDMLRFHDFLRRGRPMTFEVFGKKAEVGPSTATWSGMQTPEKALVRAVSYNGGKPARKAIEAYGRQVELEFPAKGRFYWIYPDGRVEGL